MKSDQNKSHAVMAQRFESVDSLDNFPTPPWATRALLERVIKSEIQGLQSCLEPACGAGHMASVQKDYFAHVHASDIYDYGYGNVVDFQNHSYGSATYDWVITNPPFKLAEIFINEGLKIARIGVAVIVRTVFLESVGRYHRLFSTTPPAIVAQFSERVPMVKGRLDRRATTATGYAWCVWKKGHKGHPKLVWIEPCRKDLERTKDYVEDLTSTYQL